MLLLEGTFVWGSGDVTPPLLPGRTRVLQGRAIEMNEFSGIKLDPGHP